MASGNVIETQDAIFCIIRGWKFLADCSIGTYSHGHLGADDEVNGRSHVN